MTSEAIEVMHIDIVNSEILRVQHKFADEFVNPSPVTNVVIAAFTTAHAGLKLYSYLEKLQEQVLVTTFGCTLNYLTSVSSLYAVALIYNSEAVPYI